jgi:Raf kinase inhibitor-like YbhB/YbcL family protein
MVLGIQRSRFANVKRTLLLGAIICAAVANVFVSTGSLMTPPETRRKMDLASSAFKDGQSIPSQYTCDDKNISPPLTWKGAPANTQSFLLMMDDPDGPTGVWTHWLLFNLPASVTELPENFSNTSSTIAEAKQGVNDFKNPGYGGPCPPAGKSHRYFFKLFALDITLQLPPGASRKDVEAAITKHVLSAGQLMGTYQRK